jgi:glucose/arabinose dehydrogenase
MKYQSLAPRSLRRFASLIAAACALMVAAEVSAQPIPQTVTMRNFFKVGNDSLTFNRPLLVKPYPTEDSAFIVLQQNGRIVTVRWTGTAWSKTDSASITVVNGNSGIQEDGLLGFAFHPGFAQNRKYYVFFVGGTTSARLNVVAERIAGPSGRPATTDAHRTVLRITDPYDNHNGGTIAFDKEGYLVIAIGDGGTTQGDPQNRAQNPDSLLGKFLRIDVDSPDAYPSDTTRNYAIPSTNPYKDSANVRPEIWARGLRNPWKWTIHPVTGEIWAGDVGQDRWEEITRVPKGANLGWRQREGNVCFNPTTNCLSDGLQPPAMALQRSHATSITGGTFFLGDPSSAFHGTYIFGDYGTTRNMWAARVQNGMLVDSTRIGEFNKVVSFDRDRQGRILATSISATVGFGISSNIGRVVVLESPDMVLGPVSLRPAVSPRLASLTLQSILSQRSRYVLTRLDGTVILGVPTGAFVVREKGRDGQGAGQARLMTTLAP